MNNHQSIINPRFVCCFCCHCHISGARGASWASAGRRNRGHSVAGRCRCHFLLCGAPIAGESRTGPGHAGPITSPEILWEDDENHLVGGLEHDLYFPWSFPIDYFSRWLKPPTSWKLMTGTRTWCRQHPWKTLTNMLCLDMFGTNGYAVKLWLCVFSGNVCWRTFRGVRCPAIDLCFWWNVTSLRPFHITQVWPSLPCQRTGRWGQSEPNWGSQIVNCGFLTRGGGRC